MLNRFWGVAFQWVVVKGDPGIATANLTKDPASLDCDSGQHPLLQRQVHEFGARGAVRGLLAHGVCVCEFILSSSTAG